MELGIYNRVASGRRKAKRAEGEAVYVGIGIMDYVACLVVLWDIRPYWVGMLRGGEERRMP